jgi:ribonuclease P/MRP protein subunit POP8
MAANEPGHLLEEPSHNPTGTTSSEKSTRIKAPKPNPSASEVTIKKPTWAYIHLQHLVPPSEKGQPLDAVTAQLHLSAGLRAFLGLHGTAIPVDFLKIENQQVWIRVPAEDCQAVVAAAGGWSDSRGHGWRARGWSFWSASVAGRDAGQDLFDGT